MTFPSSFQHTFRSRALALHTAAAVLAIFASLAPQTLHAQEAPALGNVSTRGLVGTGENVMIAGFIIQGTAPRNILIRAIGPSLANQLQGTLANPQLELYSRSTSIASNDDWQTDLSADAIRASGLAPNSDRESALVRSLAPGPYTAIVTGKGDTSGIGLVEAYDLDTLASTAPSASRVLNLSTRGRVGQGDNVMIMGFVVRGTEPRNFLINTIGGSLAESGLTSFLADPVLEIYSGGQKIAEADDWISSPDFAAIARTGLSPRDPLEPALWIRLNPGPYTAIVRGSGGAEGIAVPELYELRTVGDVRFSPTSLADRTGKLAYALGGVAENIEITFTGGAVARVGTGAAGTYTYTVTDNFKATLGVQASGYTLSGTLQFYRNHVAVYEGKIQKPGGTSQDTGGILVLAAP